MSNRGNGKTIRCMEAHAAYQHDWCLLWPFASKLHGYGQFSHLGKRYYAHRFMCELRHGPAPSEKHEAAHSCGRGHDGCVNPNHLSWKTKSGNQLDCRQHGTQAKTRAGRMGLLSFAKAAEIRSLQGIKLQREIAEQYGVSESAISDVWLGRTWSKEKKTKEWTPEEDARIKEAVELGYNFPRMAEHVGRSVSAVMGRTYRLGLTSGRPPTRKDFSAARLSRS